MGEEIIRLGDIETTTTKKFTAVKILFFKRCGY